VAETSAIRLSEHFTLAEMSRTSATHLDNTPPAEIVPKLAILCGALLERIRAQFGAIYVASGYRSPAVNRFVRGSRRSQHMAGEAADITPVAVLKRVVNFYDVARWIANPSSGVDFDQLILEFIGKDGFGGWLHVSFRSINENRNEILIASRDRRGDVVYTPILAREIPQAEEPK